MPAAAGVTSKRQGMDRIGEPGQTGELGRRPLPIQRTLGENSSRGRGMQSSGRPDKQVGQKVVVVLVQAKI